MTPHTKALEKSIHRHSKVAEKHKLVGTLSYRLPKSISPKQKRVSKSRFQAAFNAKANEYYNKKSPKQKAEYEREESALRRHPDDRGY